MYLPLDYPRLISRYISPNILIETNINSRAFVLFSDGSIPRSGLLSLILDSFRKKEPRRTILPRQRFTCIPGSAVGRNATSYVLSLGWTWNPEHIIEKKDIRIVHRKHGNTERRALLISISIRNVEPKRWGILGVPHDN
jgi:hypothetical protein